MSNISSSASLTSNIEKINVGTQTKENNDDSSDDDWNEIEQILEFDFDERG